MIKHLTAQVALDKRDQLGEAPVWDGRGQRLLWCDHVGHVIREAQSSADGWRETRRWELSRPVAVAIPRVRGGLVLAAGMDILTFDEHRAGAEAVHGIARLEAKSDLVRINDAKCDAKGRLWADTLSSDFKVGAGSLYRIDADGQVAQVLNGLTLPNGIDWSPDSATFYVVESITREVLAFDFDLQGGSVSNPRTLVRFTEGVPNGLAVDRVGNLWIASTGGSGLQCYTPNGDLFAYVEISTSGATSCCFGGVNGDYLFVTSRSGRLPEFASAMGVKPTMMEITGPEAGALFVCRPSATGAPAYMFEG